VTPEHATRRPVEKRKSERTHVMLPARLTWKDQRGTTRFASVMTRDISEYGVFVELPSPVSIGLFRLTQFQLERDARDTRGLPHAVRQGRLLAAVYRVHPPTRAGGRQGLALRLMVDPRRFPSGGTSDSAQTDASASPPPVADEPLGVV
jgi:hypothetical protein